MVKLFDTKVDISIRLFIILWWTAILANTVGFLSNLIFYGFAADTVFYGICAIAILLIGLFQKKTEKEKIAAGMILALINIVEFPVMYYIYGAGRSAYMILGILGILVFSRKEKRVILAIIVMCFDIIVMIISVVYPSMYLTVTPASDIGAAIVTFVIVMVSLILIIVLIVKQYEIQNQRLLIMAEELKGMAVKDPLTSLYNRRYLTEYIEKLMSKNNAAFAVVLLDLDDFKAVNDTYGHLYGDEVLQNFSKIIKKNVQEQGMAARFGGEEFMLVLNMVEEKEIEIVMETIREEFKQFSMETKGIVLTFSGGVEIFHKADHITSLFNAADEKLYQAKHQGKNKVIYHNARMLS